MSDSVVLCPFWRESRSFTRRFCGNLRDGVPLCIGNGFFRAWDEDFERASMVMGRAELEYYFPKQFVEFCRSVVRSGVYDAVRPDFEESGCFFGGLCVRPEFHGFDGCFDCSRWKR
jgi:hypothetical protein